MRRELRVPRGMGQYGTDNGCIVTFEKRLIDSMLPFLVT